jgi:hypothetical protein
MLSMNDGLQKKPVLIIIFNHRYDKNLKPLRELYKEKFSDIYFLVPFYDGDDKDVIPVFNSSYYFQGYIQEALPKYFRDRYSHYIFIGDDLILNPDLNEDNIVNKLKLEDGKSYIPNPRSITDPKFWGHNKKIVDFDLNAKGIECSTYLPNKKEALEKLQGFGKIKRYFRISQVIRLIDRPSAYKYIFKLKWFRFPLSYPLLMAYSDILIVSDSTIRKFCYYSGIFASLRLFVESAIPTALALSTDKIITNKDIDYEDGALWTKKEIANIENKYGKNLKVLMNEYPKEFLYLHPIKLSKWKK